MRCRSQSTDFSSYLIKAQSANPDALILLLAGDDMINCLKQAVQFGLDKKFHIAGAQQELEVNSGLPPEALFGDWVFEWYWKQPGVPHVPRVRRRHPQAQRRPCADGAHLVRLRRDLELHSSPPSKAKSLDAGQAGQGDAGPGAAARGGVDAEQSVLPHRRQPADADARSSAIRSRPRPAATRRICSRSPRK